MDILGAVAVYIASCAYVARTHTHNGAVDCHIGLSLTYQLACPKIAWLM